MIDILVTSADEGRLAAVVRLIAECGPYRTTRVAGRPHELASRADTLDAFDVLIVDATVVQGADLTAISDLCHRHDHLTCILLIPEALPQALIDAMRAGFRDVLSGPPERSAIGEALQRAVVRSGQRDTRRTRVVSFMSCKGGAGTSFIAANVAHLVAGAHAQRVLLVDLNPLYGDAAFLVTSDTPPSTLEALCTHVDRMDAAFFDASVLHVSSNFDVLAGAGDPIKAAEIRADRLEWVLGVATPRYDCVILDLGQTINPLSMLALDRSDEIHIVLQTTMPHLRAGRRLIDILHSLGYGQERLHLLLNRHNRHSDQARDAAQNVLGMKPQLVIADDSRAVAEAVNQGLPIAETSRSSPVTRSLQALAASIAAPGRTSGETAAKRDSLITRLVGRQPAPKFRAL